LTRAPRRAPGVPPTRRAVAVARSRYHGVFPWRGLAGRHVDRRAELDPAGHAQGGPAGRLAPPWRNQRAVAGRRLATPRAIPGAGRPTDPGPRDADRRRSDRGSRGTKLALTLSG